MEEDGIREERMEFVEWMVGSMVWICMSVQCDTIRDGTKEEFMLLCP